MSTPESRAQREALGRLRTAVNARLFNLYAERDRAAATIENLNRLERSLLEEGRALDAMLELTNPYRRSGQ